MTEAAQAQIQASAKGSRLESCHGEGHALFVDEAKQFDSVLGNFLSSLST